MASISLDRKTNRRTVQFVAGDGKRRSIRLGKVPAANAKSVKVMIERLIASKVTGHPASLDTLTWLNNLDESLYSRLVAVGLAEQRCIATLERFIDSYFENRKDIKRSTLTIWGNVKRNLIEYFGPEKPLREISEADAEDWERYLIAQSLSEATVGKRVGIAKQFFKFALKSRMIDSSPFQSLKAGSQKNPSRKVYVERSVVENVIAASPNAEWRLIIALSRYAGLRCPSETLNLRWSDINWERQRMNVRSPKTEKHTGKGSRVIPIFPEVRPYLDQLFDEAEDGSEYVISSFSRDTRNLRTQMVRIIERAGETVWPSLFNNLRGSAATDLIEKYPAHICNGWMGHCEAVARDHYRQITDEHYEKAVQNPVQQPTAKPRKQPKHQPVKCDDSAEFPIVAKDCNVIPKLKVVASGLEFLTGCSHFCRFWILVL